MTHTVTHGVEGAKGFRIDARGNIKPFLSSDILGYKFLYGNYHSIYKFLCTWPQIFVFVDFFSFSRNMARETAMMSWFTVSQAGFGVIYSKSAHFESAHPVLEPNYAKMKNFQSKPKFAAMYICV